MVNRSIEQQKDSSVVLYFEVKYIRFGLNILNQIDDSVQLVLRIKSNHLHT